jgi:hypothetical protein
MEPAMWRLLLPWTEAFLSLIGLAAILTIQPIAIPLLAFVVFLFAYFGIPEVKEFVHTHPNTAYAVGGVTVLSPWGLRLGLPGILLTMIVLVVAAYIIMREITIVS